MSSRRIAQKHAYQGQKAPHDPPLEHPFEAGDVRRASLCSQSDGSAAKPTRSCLKAAVCHVPLSSKRLRAEIRTLALSSGASSCQSTQDDRGTEECADGREAVSWLGDAEPAHP